jgi:glutathione S-transferase
VEFILHHYDTSPFSEKPRLMFGLTGASWRSVIQPTIMPKPELTALTGGYRRAPVMQIGADVFCDSQVIMAEIAARGGLAIEPMAWAVNFWADRLWFAASVAVIFGEMADQVPAEFVADREKLMGRPFDLAAMKAAAGAMRGQWRAQAAWIEAALGGDAPFLSGADAGLADIAAYMNVWFLTRFSPHLAGPLLDGFASLEAWRMRVAAIGHGRREEMSREEALEAARRAEPGEFTVHDPAEGLTPGAPVSVAADDYGRDPIAGRLVALTRERVVIERQDPALGRLHLHFPRAGYTVSAT